MAGFFKKVFSFGKKEVVETAPEDEPLAPINWAALKDLNKQEPSQPVVETQVPEPEAPKSGALGLEAAVDEPLAHIPESPQPADAPAPAPTTLDESPVEPALVEAELPTEAPVEAEAPARRKPAPRKIEKPAPTPAQSPASEPPAAVAVEPELDIELPPAPPQPEPPRAVEPTRPTPTLAAPKPSADDELGKIDWAALREFTRQNEPPAPDPTKLVVGKKVEQKVVQASPKPAPRVPWFQRLRQGLAKSSRELSSNISSLVTKRKLDEATLQDLEDVLLRADLGLETAMRVTDTLASTRHGREVTDLEVRTVMGSEIEKVLTPVAKPLELDLNHKPHVILVVGVNGTGKTTTIGKLAAKLTDGGLSVMLAAGDTFRAAAIEQLKIWGERVGAPVVSSKLGADAAGLAYDAFEKARAAGTDVLIIDTAGRLQNKAELMAELEKIVRVLGKLDPDAPHTVLQTVDATTGQNALNQVEIFSNIAGVNGLVMTKLDGTARGGILVAIAAKHKVPVYFIGVGEQVDDLEPFVAGDFAKAIAGVG